MTEIRLSAVIVSVTVPLQAYMYHINVISLEYKLMTQIMVQTMHMALNRVYHV